MLESLAIKNFALIKEAHIDFKDKLNVLTGETGSGKSILLGSINLALGKRIGKDFLRNDDETCVTIAFDIKDKKTINYLKNENILLDDGKLIIYRKVTKDKSINKINDEPCTLSKLRDITEKLIDIYGQHDGDDLRKTDKHIEFLDDFIGQKVYDLKEKIDVEYEKLKAAKEKLSAFDIDEKMRLREIDILKYEIDEFNDAMIKDGEEEEIATKFKVASNSKNIIMGLNKALSILKDLDINIAIREIKDVVKYDNSFLDLYNSLLDVEAIVSDDIKEIDAKVDNYDIDEEEYHNLEKRLDNIRSILAKYDNSLEVAKKEIYEKTKRLDELENYDREKNKAKELYDSCNKELYQLCDELTNIRKKGKIDFIKRIKVELSDLGFNDVNFDIDIKPKDRPTKNGIDEVTFLVSLNKGEQLKPLELIASGGELSRIMLSIKTVLSETFGTETLVFDEIDAGISGITASKVAVKLNKIAKNHQVILITHLPQIAAMADTHFVIKKENENNRTITEINELDDKGMLEEIGRLISSDGNITKTVMANAKELKNSANKMKD